MNINEELRTFREHDDIRSINAHYVGVCKEELKKFGTTNTREENIIMFNLTPYPAGNPKIWAESLERLGMITGYDKDMAFKIAAEELQIFEKS